MAVTQNLAAEYNATRTCRDTSVLCHAPFSNIYFNQFGQGLACCFNTNHVLGTYPHETVSEMWYGRQASALREAMRRDDFSAGCQGCAHQLASRNFSGIMSVFDHLADTPAALAQVDRTDVELPRSLEFSLSNACNLECVMCTGDFSSSIRKRREGRPRMDNPYDFRFLEQLEPFLPSLRMARFFGGEPFLTRMYYRIWDRLHQVNPDVDIRITTNGTALLDRARRLLAGLRCRITMSVDSLERETYELIRRNASYDLLRENMEYFASYCTERGFPLNLAVCPMQQNWRELPDMVSYCNDRGFDIGFNTVYYPPSCSLRMLPYDQLTEVLDHWRSREWHTTDWLQSGNVARFEGVINQVAQWREEARASSSMANLADADSQSTQQRDNVDASAFSAVISVGQATHREQLRALLERGETQAFVTRFFEALNRTYQSVGRHVPEAEQATVQAKIQLLGDILAERVTDRSALQTLSRMDARDLLAWIAMQPKDTFTSVADQWIKNGLAMGRPLDCEDR